jgi:hypothetical protein
MDTLFNPTGASLTGTPFFIYILLKKRINSVSPLKIALSSFDEFDSFDLFFQ